MSRIRSTLDTAIKAVCGTVNTKLLFKAAHLRPSDSSMTKTKEVKGDLEPAAVMTIKVDDQARAKQENNGKDAPKPQVKTIRCFQPSAFRTDMDETSCHLSQHVSTYFGRETQKLLHSDGSSVVPSSTTQFSGTKKQDSMLEPLTSPTTLNTDCPSSRSDDSTALPKTGMSSKSPNISSLVSKFRIVLKSAAAEKDKAAEAVPAISQDPELAESSEEKQAEKNKAQKLLSQREKILAQVSVDNRTKTLVQVMRKVTDMKLITSKVEELSAHLLQHPETRGVAVNEKVIPSLLRLCQTHDLKLQAEVRQALAIVGYTAPVKGRGIRILSIDGGGTRGLVALQTLHKLERLTGKPIHQLFDYICGVSTGAILAFMLGVFRIPLTECEELYRKLGSDVFKQNVIVGTVKMGWSHAFYDSEIWEKILKDQIGPTLLISTAKDPECPKVAAVSTLVNRGLPLKAYVFRNYNFLPSVRSHYLGGCQHKMWQAIRSSSAAPGYFLEYVLGQDLHQDGGLLINNPTALAIHECKCLWPNSPVQCVVSLGTGLYEATGKNSSSSYTSLKTKLTHVISSATDTEEVHTMLNGLLPPNSYFRFNPYLSEDVPLDESRHERLNFLQDQGQRYLERNEPKLKKAAAVLLQEKSAIQRLAEWAKLKAEIYNGFPYSKL